jgi:hypothetical protein
MAQARNSSADQKTPSYFDGRHRFRGRSGRARSRDFDRRVGAFLFLGSNLESAPPAVASDRPGLDHTAKRLWLAAYDITELSKFHNPSCAHQTHFGGSSAGRLVRWHGGAPAVSRLMSVTPLDPPTPSFETRKMQKVVTRSEQHVAINSAISWSE